MSRWQPMASVVMMAPSITNMSRSAGMAMISLDLSATLTWPSTRRWRAAKADTMWIAAFAPFLLAEPRNVLPSMATTSADTPISLATQATKRRWNSALSSVAKMSPRWSCDGVPSRNGRNRRRNAIFFWPNRAISTKVSAPASTASKHNSSTSWSGQITLPRCLGSGKSLKHPKKTIASPYAADPATASIAPSANRIRRITTDSALQPFVTRYFTRLPCSPGALPWTTLFTAVNVVYGWCLGGASMAVIERNSGESDPVHDFAWHRAHRARRSGQSIDLVMVVGWAALVGWVLLRH